MTPLLNKIRPPEDFGVSDAAWRHTFDAITDLVSVIDKDFRLIMVNRALAEFLHKQPEELIGKHCYEIMHGRASHWDGCPHKLMMQEKRAVTRQVYDPFIGLPLLISAFPIFDDTGDLIGSVHVVKDISIMQKMQNDLAVRNQQLETLNRLCREAINSQTLGEMVATTMAEIMSACTPDLVLCYTRCEKELTIQGVLPDNENYRNKNEKLGICLCGLAAAKGEAVFSEDIHRDARCTENECRQAGIRSFAALPLIQDQKVIGVLGFASKAARNFAEEKEFLETLASTVSVILQNALLIEKIRKQSDLLEEKVKMRTVELRGRNAVLERFNKVMVGRELRMVELKKEIKTLRTQLDRKGEQGE